MSILFDVGSQPIKNQICEEEDKMNKKTGGIIATITTALLFGLPGLCLCIAGIITAMGKMPLSSEFPYTSNFGNPYSEMVPSYLGFVLLCVALFFIAIPIIVGVLTLRNKPRKPASINEPFPPVG
jgi:hypothetical protein